MQPCAVCGGQVVDAAGYCAVCGTYRGEPPAAMTAPPAPHGPQSTPAPSAPARTRSPYVLALVALSVTLMVLVVAIVVVVLARSRDGDGGPLVDGCVVGRWRVSSHSERLPISGTGDVTFTGDGTRMDLDADGTGLTDYGRGTEFRATVDNRPVVLTLAGTVRYSFRTANGAISFSDVKPEGTATITIDGVELRREPLQANNDPARYTCSGDTLTEQTDRYQVRLTRLPD